MQCIKFCDKEQAKKLLNFAKVTMDNLCIPNVFFTKILILLIRQSLPRQSFALYGKCDYLYSKIARLNYSNIYLLPNKNQSCLHLVVFQDIATVLKYSVTKAPTPALYCTCVLSSKTLSYLLVFSIANLLNL